MFTDKGCNSFTCSEEGDEIGAEAVNCPRRRRRTAPLHQRLQQHGCSNVSLYGARWHHMIKCKCNLR